MPIYAIAALVFFAAVTAVIFVQWRRTVPAEEAADQPVHPNPERLKVVILYSSIGAGHISAARSIQREIGRQDPGAAVVLRDIRVFMSPVRRRIDERLYWFIANNMPECFETLFWRMQEEGNAAASLAALPNDYPEEKVLAFLRAEAPQTALATHYGSAQVLGTLRERGLLSEVKLGWLHTDFFEGYFPRISKRIDRTFLAHPALEARWLAAGVPADLIVTSGMPVDVPPAPAAIRERTLTGLSLDPALPTVVITGGKEGAGDYLGVVRSLARRVAGPAQLVALCGTNERNVEALGKLAPSLAPKVTMRPLGVVPQETVVALMRSADVLVTKAGGLTPAEAFSIGTPTVLLDVVRGHERENAKLFGSLGLAELAADAEEAAEAIALLLSDAGRRNAMLAAQAEFRKGADVARIARFALDSAERPRSAPPGFGTENGPPAGDVGRALAQLGAEVPADVELLLSYSTAKIPERIVRENPFGHLAIRVGETVLSTNHIADADRNQTLLQHLSLADYLFGVTPPTGKQEHTSTYGLAYGRDTIGLRVTGMSEVSRAAMLAEADRIEAEFRVRATRWDRRNFNCADAVARILAAGGWNLAAWSGPRSMNTMPLDVFDRALGHFQEDLALRVDLIAYRKLAGSKSSYRFSRFPLSLTQPLRSIARVVTNFSPDVLEESVTKQVIGYGDRRLFVEDLNARPAASAQGNVRGLVSHSRLSLERAFADDIQRLVATRASLPHEALRRLRDRHPPTELRHLVETGRDMARLATERAEEVLFRRTSARLREIFTALDQEYGALGSGPWQSSQIETYLCHLQEFGEQLAGEFARLRALRRARTNRALQRIRRVWRRARCAVWTRRPSPPAGKRAVPEP